MARINSLFLAIAITFLTALVSARPSQCGVQYGGYLGVYFMDDTEQINAMLSVGNDANDFTPLNNGAPILRSSVGTSHTRDPQIFRHPRGRKNYIIATDNSLRLPASSPQASIKTASRKIVIFESNGDSLTDWKMGRLSKNLMSEESGGCSAPEAIWDAEKEKFLVTFSAPVWPKNDPKKTTTPAPASQIYYTYTYDFVDFEETKLYYSIKGGGLVDMTIVQMGPQCFVRFFRDDTNGALKVRGQRSDNGLWGNWTDIGSGREYVANEASGGPLVFRDNVDRGLWHVWIDTFKTGYRPFETNNIREFGYNTSDAPNFLKNLKQGAVLPVTVREYANLKNKVWSTT